MWNIGNLYVISEIGIAIGNIKLEGGSEIIVWVVAVGGVLVVPDLVKAPDFLKKAINALMPFFVPRMTGRAIESEGSWRMLRFCAYLGHSRRMCSLVWNVVLSHEHVVSSPRVG